MAITYTQAPMPIWILINLQGTLAGGGQLFTYSSLTRQPKAVYSTPDNSAPYTNPVRFGLNGTQGPFYWQYDSASPDDLYFLVAKDSDDNVLWEVDDFNPNASGGGGTVTVYQSLDNYIGNSQLIDHIDNTASPIGLTNLVIAPGNHKGFTPALVNPIVGTYGVLGPDNRFVKNNTSATDQITFVEFTQADNPFTGDVTPVDYVRYQCTVAGVGETYKCFQFPICQKVKNLNNQQMTFQFWARVAATPVDVKVYSRQYFGSGTATTPESNATRVLQDTITLTTTWTPYTVQFTVPATAGKSIGTPGLQTDDDAFYMQLEMPLGQICDVHFAKPVLHLGDIDPDKDFANYDQIDAITMTPRTGDVKMSMLSSVPGGWVNMNDGSIGNVGSAATIRANKDTFQLYKTLWDGVSDVWAPVSGGRGATAQADFVANKTLTLPKALGRVLMGQNGAYGTVLTFTADPASDQCTVSSTATLQTGMPVLVSNSGGGLPGGLSANTVYYIAVLTGTTFAFYPSVNDAQALTNPVDITTAGTGTQSLLSSLGATLGEGRHQLTIAEMPAHTHTIGFNIPNNSVLASGGGFNSTNQNTTTTSSTGGDGYHNNMQPTLITNIFIKL